MANGQVKICDSISISVHFMLETTFFNNSYAVVTGASDGIGKEYAFEVSYLSFLDVGIIIVDTNHRVLHVTIDSQ